MLDLVSAEEAVVDRSEPDGRPPVESADDRDGIVGGSTRPSVGTGARSDPATRIAFVGAGPTTIYTLHSLLQNARQGFSVTIFEEQASVGRGTPYRPGWNDAAMLSNIASIEIPPLVDSLVEWLRRQPPELLRSRGIDAATIDDRCFYPRVVLGDFFHDQLAAMIDRARASGVEVTIRGRSRVIDVATSRSGVELTIGGRGGDTTERFDHVVLATGHQWPDDPQVRPGYFLSPWPASALKAIAPCEIGIRGTSLTAIDAVVAIAVANGAFVATDAGDVNYAPAPGTDALHMTMMSRKGLLPEADFFHPIPYEPLRYCTAEAMEAIIDGPEAGRLDRAFALFQRELGAADPAYASRIGLSEIALDEFCARYFADRVAHDPFAWAKANLAETEANQAAGVTVPWRYAILRMHEVIALLVPHLGDADFQRFTRRFKPIFVDDYATVPHESIRRLLALHRAGKLDILAIGDDYRVDSRNPDSGAILDIDGERRHFPVFIEATGQRPLAAKDFPFPSLRAQGVVRDAEHAAGGAERGIVVDDVFHPIGGGVAADRVFCLSLPFLLGRHPFIQGITSSHEMGDVVGGELASIVARSLERSVSGSLANQTHTGEHVA